MKTVEEAKLMLEELGKMQESGAVSGLPCPRCGYDRMNEDMVLNALSRRAEVYICNRCGMEEAAMDASGREPLPLNEWGMVLGFDEDVQDDSDDEEERE